MERANLDDGFQRRTAPETARLKLSADSRLAASRMLLLHRCTRDATFESRARSMAFCMSVDAPRYQVRNQLWKPGRTGDAPLAQRLLVGGRLLQCQEALGEGHVAGAGVSGVRAAGAVLSHQVVVQRHRLLHPRQQPRCRREGHHLQAHDKFILFIIIIIIIIIISIIILFVLV